jgi:outer membrane protein TolC
MPAMLERTHRAPRARRALGVLFSISIAAAPSVLRAQPAPAAPAPATAPAAPPPAAPAPAASAPASGGPGEERPFDLAAALREGTAPLSANEAAQRAVATAPSMDSARAATAQANAAASQALVSVYPRIELEASYTRLSNHRPALIGEFPIAGMLTQFRGVDSIDDHMALQARLAYPVSDLFFEYLPRYDAAMKLGELQRLREVSQEQTVALDARVAYYAYARARAARVIARSALEQTEAQRKDVDALVKGGALARVELMRAEAQVAAAKVALSRAEGSVAVAATALRSLLHIEGEGDIALTEDLTQPLPPLAGNKAQLLATARKNRSELKVLREMAGVHEQNIDAENGAKLPTLSIIGSVEYSNPNQRVAPFEEEFKSSWQAGASLIWSPNDFATADARADRAAADRMATEAELRALEDALKSEVEQAYEDYNAAQQTMEGSLAAIRAAEETYRVRREQFRAGSAVATEVIDAETDLRRARLELVSAAIDARVAAARIDRAIEK